MTSGRAFGRGVRREFFDQVCTGSPVKHAARAVGVSHQAAVAWWRNAGAMTLVRGLGACGLARPGDLLAPGGVGHRLSFDERVEIMRGRDAGLTACRDRAADPTSPVGDLRVKLHATAIPTVTITLGWLTLGPAQRACRPKASKLDNRRLCSAIETWMDDGWSPNLIADVLARDHGDDKLIRVSHETIYQCLYVQTRGSLRADLHKCLSTKRSTRKAPGRTAATGARSPRRDQNQPDDPQRSPTGRCPGTGKVI